MFQQRAMKRKQEKIDDKKHNNNIYSPSEKTLPKQL